MSIACVNTVGEVFLFQIYSIKKVLRGMYFEFCECRHSIATIGVEGTNDLTSLFWCLASQWNNYF